MEDHGNDHTHRGENVAANKPVRPAAAQEGLPVLRQLQQGHGTLQGMEGWRSYRQDRSRTCAARIAGSSATAECLSRTYAARIAGSTTAETAV